MKPNFFLFFLAFAFKSGLSESLKTFNDKFIYRCADMEKDGRTFSMIPFPTDFVTCTCNFNKPSNVRCKWKKVKNSIIRCVRADKSKFQNDPVFYDDMYDESF